MSEIDDLRADIRVLRDEIASLRAQMEQTIEVHHYYHTMPAPQPARPSYWTPWDSRNVCESAGLQIETGPGVSVEMINGTVGP